MKKDDKDYPLFSIIFAGSLITLTIVYFNPNISKEMLYFIWIASSAFLACLRNIFKS